MWGNRDKISNRYDEREIHRNGWKNGEAYSLEHNPLYDIPGMEYPNLQFRMTELQIAEKNAAFFANIKGGEELAARYAERVARLKKSD